MENDFFDWCKSNKYTDNDFIWGMKKAYMIYIQQGMVTPTAYKLML